MSCALAVHGGAGSADQENPAARAKALGVAIKRGAAILSAGGSALDAVERAVCVMEDTPRFNAGTGSVLTWDGRVEMDASIMGDQDRFGAVAAVSDIRNPVCVARRVLEKTPHWLLAGSGALVFARQQGFGPWNAVTPVRRKRWQALRGAVLAAAQAEGPAQSGGTQRFSELVRFVRENPEVRGTPGTVGAVALDARGGAAAATSTGGIWLKLPGRVGDSALPGAGTFTGPGGAVSATGQGEAIVRAQVSRRTEAHLREVGAPAAVKRAMKEATGAGCECGVIAVDRKGRVGYAFNTAAMPVEVWLG